MAECTDVSEAETCKTLDELECRLYDHVCQLEAFEKNACAIEEKLNETRIKALVKARCCGELLLAAKNNKEWISHGQFELWREERGIKKSKATLYQRIAKHWNELLPLVNAGEVTTIVEARDFITTLHGRNRDEIDHDDPLSPRTSFITSLRR